MILGLINPHFAKLVQGTNIKKLLGFTPGQRALYIHYTVCSFVNFHTEAQVNRHIPLTVVMLRAFLVVAAKV